MKDKIQIGVFISIVAVIFILYLPSILFSGFHGDDFTHLYRLGSPNLTTALNRCWTGHVYGSAPDHNYRPVANSLFTLLSQLGGRAWMFHVFSVLLHAGSVYLLFCLLLQFKIPQKIAAWMVLVLAVHSSIAATILWATAMCYLVLAFFFLLSIYFLFQRKYSTGLLFYFLALLSNEMAVMGLIPIVILFLKQHLNIKTAIWRSTGFFTVAVAFIAIRWCVLREPLTSATDVYFHFSGYSIMGFFRFAHWLMFPWPVEWTKMWLFLPIIGIAFYIPPIYFFLKRSSWHQLTISLVWMIAFFIPVAGAPADWYVYLSLVGWSIFAAIIMKYTPAEWRMLFVLFFLLSGIITTLHQNINYIKAAAIANRQLKIIAEEPTDSLVIIGFPKTFIRAPMLSTPGNLMNALKLIHNQFKHVEYILPIVISHPDQNVTVSRENSDTWLFSTGSEYYPFFWIMHRDGFQSSKFGDRLQILSRNRFGIPDRVKMVRTDTDYTIWHHRKIIKLSNEIKLKNPLEN